MHTCTGSSLESVTLNFVSGTETAATNNITVSSADVHENQTTNDTTFNLPIDNVAPVVSVVSSNDVTQGEEATITINVTEGNPLNFNLSPVPSLGRLVASCEIINGLNVNCDFVITEMNVGNLELTIGVGEIEDIAGNTNASDITASLNVEASTLAITHSPGVVNIQNASSFESWSV